MAVNMKKLQHNYREMRSKERHDIRELDAEGADRMAKKALDEGKYRKQYRSNLKKICKFLDGIKFTASHIECLKTTPFYPFLKPFIDKEVNQQNLIGTQHGLVEILVSYNRRHKAFDVGGHLLTISPREFDLIFGITSGQKDIDMNPCSVHETSVGRRLFGDRRNTKIYSTDLKGKLELCAKRSEQRYIEDTVRIIILHTMGFVLYVASSEYASGWMFRICENLDQLHEYNWGKACVEYLMHYVDTKDAGHVGGCTSLLQYWFCERSSIIKPAHPDAFPRFRRWDLTELCDALKNLALKDIKSRNVKRRSITPHREELRCLRTERGESSTTTKHTLKSAGDVSSVERFDISALNEDEIPLCMLHTNADTSIPKGKAKATYHAGVLSTRDDKILQLTEKYLRTKEENLQLKERELELKEKELEMREEKLQEAKNELEMTKEELQIKMTKLEEKLSEAESEAHKWKLLHGEAQKWKAMHDDEVESKNKIEAELNDMIGVQAMKSIDNNQLNSAMACLEPNHIVRTSSVDAAVKEKTPVEHEMPSFSIGMTQIDLDLGDSTADTPASTAQGGCKAITAAEGNRKTTNVNPQSFVANRTRRAVAVVSPPAKSIENKLGKRLGLYRTFQKIRDDNCRGTVEFLAGRKDLKGTTLWMSDDRQIRVNYDDIFACLQGGCLSNNIIDAYNRIKYLHQQQGMLITDKSNELCGTTFVSDSLLLGEILRSPSKTLVPCEELFENRYLMFPILHERDPTLIGKNHWTLVAVDTKKKEWRYYNSLRPRTGRKDNYLEDALELKRACARTADRYGVPLPWDAPLIEVEGSPQQKDSSVDCGVVVLLLIKKYFEQKPIVPGLEKEISGMRTEIVETILNWSKGQPYYVDQKKKRKLNQ